MLTYFWFVLIVVLGVVVGSFLNVCIARLPLEKSLFWPGSHCGKCFQPIRWYDNIPLFSYLFLRGKCRHCGAHYSFRYFAVELVTGLGWLGLFYLEVVQNLHGWPPCGARERDFLDGNFPWQWMVGFGFHAILFSFLLVAACCDLDGREIPLGLTLTGAVVGLLGAVLLPWPWPWDPSAGLLQQQKVNAIVFSPQLPLKQMEKMPWCDFANVGPKEGVYPWPVWGPVPDWLPPGSWQMGLATGLAGLLVGTLFVRMIAFLFGKGLGREALGLGDADLMMMAGAFLGWQVVLVAFFVSVFPALLVGISQLIIHRDNSMPFGPSLAVGILATMLCWHWIGPVLQPLLFFGWLLVCLLVVVAGFMFLSSFLLRAVRPAK